MPTHAALTAHDRACVLHTDTHKWFAHGCTHCSTDSVTCTKHTMSSGEVTSTPYTHTACTRAQALSVHLHSPPMSNCNCTGCTPTVRAQRCGAHPTPVCMHSCCGHTQSTNRSSDTALHPSADTWGPAMPLHVAVHLSQLCSSTQTHSKATCVPPAVSSGGLTHPPTPPAQPPRWHSPRNRRCCDISAAGNGHALWPTAASVATKPGAMGCRAPPGAMVLLLPLAVLLAVCRPGHGFSGTCE